MKLRTPRRTPAQQRVYLIEQVTRFINQPLNANDLAEDDLDTALHLIKLARRHSRELESAVSRALSFAQMDGEFTGVVPAREFWREWKREQGIAS